MISLVIRSIVSHFFSSTTLVPLLSINPVRIYGSLVSSAIAYGNDLPSLATTSRMFLIVLPCYELCEKLNRIMFIPVAISSSISSITEDGPMEQIMPGSRRNAVCVLIIFEYMHSKCDTDFGFILWP